MGNVFNKPAAPQGRKITDKDRAVLDLKVQRDKLKQYQKKIQAVVDREVQVAKEHLKNGDKRRALIALKKKKYQLQLLDQTDNQLLNLEQLTNSIEYALVEQDVIKGLEQGNQVLKEIHKELSVEAVQKLMDDTADAIAYQNEVEEILGSKLTEQDDAQIEAELDAMVEQQQVQLPSVPVEPIDLALPDVPDTQPRIRIPAKASKVDQTPEDPVAA
ncbi:hypothetical protein SmJEL517_g05063 [Synchytrium microbalum]|uniref:Charged multivesicular body protein 6 n=1 Tax=Synchytrium microbalum TaxID=1806994 RepID=A0A507BX17_9FUNG|nr:uncharacterized protein SmJEL517_g05063 [Synchytrium microbalum]TPX31688.1 hypothetical protein SmJEL517_g05063 [Synchytrium microbalum]